MAKKILEFIVVGLSLVTFSVFVVVFAFDYAGGCGEAYEYANGTIHQGECLGREFFKQFLKEAFHL
jgi:hypothetical protein